MAKRKGNPAHYVDNVALLENLIKYRVQVLAAKEHNGKVPPVTNSIANDILKICERNGTRKNFIGYPFRDDMVSESILDCIKAAKNFDSEYSSNPFGYFSRIAHWACVRVIQAEKHHEFVKYQSFASLDQKLKGALSHESGQSQSSVRDSYNKALRVTPRDLQKFESRGEELLKVQRQKDRAKAKKAQETLKFKNPFT